MHISWQIMLATEFAAHREAWDRLNAQGLNSPLLDSRFVAPLLEHFGAGQELLGIASAQGKPVAMAIVSKAKLGAWSTFQPSQAPLGLWLCAPDIPVEALLPSFASSLPSPVLILGITQQDPYLCPQPKGHPHLSVLDYIQTAHIDIDRPFEAYWSSRGKNLRHNLKRQRNRLAREGISTRLEILEQPGDMAKAVRQYGDMESAGWKSKNGSAIHADNAQGRFYVDCLSAFAATGQCRVYCYYYNDRLVASDLCVLDSATIIILKTTYDESIAESSPTMLMRQEMFQDIFDSKTLRRIEFYGKVMDWHTKWSDSFRVMYHINYYPWRLFKMLKYTPVMGQLRKWLAPSQN